MRAATICSGIGAPELAAHCIAWILRGLAEVDGHTAGR